MMRAAVAGLIVIGAVVQACSLGPPNCANEVLFAEASPSGRHFAVVFRRGCGATTRENVQVSVRRSAESDNEPGNVLILDNLPTDGEMPRVQWKNDSVLELTVPAGARTFRRETEVDGVLITYLQPGDQ